MIEINIDPVCHLGSLEVRWIGVGSVLFLGIAIAVSLL
jgi:hypothetical protein